eukprot:m.420205 g.420205  ORF g.420205 m.420205 type:complete len:50 (-) comp21314_c0_seq2:1221-1370(-)
MRVLLWKVVGSYTEEQDRVSTWQSPLFPRDAVTQLLRLTLDELAGSYTR